MYKNWRHPSRHCKQHFVYKLFHYHYIYLLHRKYEKSSGKSTVYTYLFFTLCTQFHVAHIQTKLCWSCPYLITAEQDCCREWGQLWRRTLVERTGFRTWDVLNTTTTVPKHQAYSTCNLIFWTWERFPEARYRPSVFMFSSLCSMAATQRWTNAGTLGDSPLHTSARWQPKTGSSVKNWVREHIQ
jgi:hypothetical protein